MKKQGGGPGEGGREQPRTEVRDGRTFKVVLLPDDPQLEPDEAKRREIERAWGVGAMRKYHRAKKRKGLGG